MGQYQRRPTRVPSGQRNHSCRLQRKQHQRCRHCDCAKLWPVLVHPDREPRCAKATASNIQTHVISGETIGFNGKAITATDDKTLPTDVLYLVTVQDLQDNRKWNPADGDVSKMFIAADTTELAVCSKRGLCDYDTGMCDCFSGYSGIHCDDQNAIAYSY